jgi:hypothetical protein
MHTENSGFASPTLGQHISTFRGYRILTAAESRTSLLFALHCTLHLQFHFWKFNISEVKDFDICSRFPWQRQPFWKWSWMQFSSLPINSSLQNNPRFQFSLKSENIEILSAAILKMAAICSQFLLVRIFYQPYLIYMPSLVEIPLMVRCLLSFTGRWIPMSRGAFRSWNFQNGCRSHGNRERMSKCLTSLISETARGISTRLGIYIK